MTYNNTIESVQEISASTFQIFITDVKDSIDDDSGKAKGSSAVPNSKIEVADERIGAAKGNVDIVDTIDTDALKSMTKAEKKELFMQSAGKMKIDADAIYDLRARSMG